MQRVKVNQQSWGFPEQYVKADKRSDDRTDKVVILFISCDVFTRYCHNIRILEDTNIKFGQAL